MSTFAEAHLRDMTPAQMAQFDLFLDENDWDIYYWATQEPTPTSQETAEGAGRGPEGATANAQGTDKEPKLETDEWRQGNPRSGEWAQTIGTFKPAYRPVPARWKNSEILAMLRRHVISRSAGGIHEEPVDAKSTGGGKYAWREIERALLTIFLKVWRLCPLYSQRIVHNSLQQCYVHLIQTSLSHQICIRTCTVLKRVVL